MSGYPGENGNGLAGRLDQIARVALMVAGVGIALSIIGGLFDPRQAMLSYLMAFLFWLGLPLGCSSLLLLNHLAGGTWGLVIRRPLEAGAATTPLMTLLFLPIALTLGLIYPWAGAEHHEPEFAATGVEADETPDTTGTGVEPEETFARAEVTDADSGEPAAHGHKELYYNRPFFFGRCVGYFLVWNLAALLLYVWSGEQDRTEHDGPSRRLSLIGAPGLILLFFTGSFAAIDWMMSLDLHWYSTIYGAMAIVGMGLETFAFIIFATTLLADRGELEDLPRPGRFRDLGNLLLAFVMLWAYIQYSQFLIQWSGDLTEEIPFYLARTNGGWQYYSAALIAFHFFLPFFALLFRVNKERTDRLRLIAGGIFVVHLLDTFWLVAPSAGYDHPVPSLILPAAVAAVGGLWLAAFAFLLKLRPLVPRNDPALDELRQHEGHHNHTATQPGGA